MRKQFGRLPLLDASYPLRALCNGHGTLIKRYSQPAVIHPNEDFTGAPTTRRPRLVILGILGWGAFMFLLLTAAFFVWPASDRSQPVDAVLSLNGTYEGPTAAAAVALVQEGVAPVLLFSEGTDPPYCPQVARVEVVCFLPHPARTVGEIAFAARYARDHDLHSIMIVANRTQASRARLLAGRCFPGRALVDAISTPRSRLPSDVTYEWGATLKALFVDRGCS